ncbi:MAG: HEPN domain-containing protein [Armatimonadetes bacterium]|nr:HEPN domain-containing protein [Armatimonadota bacterium]MDW8121536.1 HEPN domain-containing protein [Armatimonadota bacterium]
MRGDSREEGKRWLDQAKEDLKWAKELAERGGYYLACFLSQQIAEKALKAFLYFSGEEIILTHSVQRLTQLPSRYDPIFWDRKGRYAIVDTFYLTTRYPNALPGTIPAHAFDKETALRAISMADEITTLVDRLIKELAL